MCSEAKSFVCVVDDDVAVRNLAREVLESHGWAVRSYASAEEFLAEFDEATSSCVVTDLRMPDVDGLQLQQRLNAMGNIVAVVVITGYADVRTAVRLMEDGILTLLEKPYEPDELARVVERAIATTHKRRQSRDELRTARRLLESLSADERAVMEFVIAGLPNKSIAMRLTLSMRTVDRRRQSVLAKMKVESAAELATLVARLKAQYP